MNTALHLPHAIMPSAYNSILKQNNDEFTVDWLELLCSFFSLIFFVISVVFWSNNPDTKIKTEYDATALSLYDEFNHTIADHNSKCVNGGIHQVKWGGSPLFAVTTVHVTIPPSVNPFSLLTWIFLVSFFFQGYRSNFLQKFDAIRKSNRHVAIGFRKMWHNKFDVDFSRWLEYVLTSPFQIFLLANSFLIYSFNTLLGLFASQVCLILTGFLNEILMDAHWKHKLQFLALMRHNTTLLQKRDGTLERASIIFTRQNNREKIQIYLVFLFEFTAFVLQWIIIFSKVITDTNLDCYRSYDDYPLTTLIVLLSGEAFLFLCFGLIQLRQYFFTFTSIDDDSAIINDKMLNSNFLSDAETKDEQIIERSWSQTQNLYTACSVISKFVLGVILIVAFRVL